MAQQITFQLHKALGAQSDQKDTETTAATYRYLVVVVVDPDVSG
jgi:hypothetical protein